MPLRLFGVPAWLPDDGGEAALPARVPQALIVFLAAQPQALTREHVAEVFWPGRAAAESQLNLRVNLHKAKRWLEDQHVSAEWLIDRRRIGLLLPTDLPAEGEVHNDTFLASFSLPEFEAFEAWVHTQRAQWQQRRTASHLRAMSQWVAAGSAELALEVLDCLDDTSLPSPVWMQALLKQTDPRAAEAATALSEALARRRAAPAASEPAGFHGRTVELAQLRASSAAATVVAGEAGIGKTRLLQVAVPDAPWLHCREGLSGLPFSPLVELLRKRPEWLHDLGASRLDLARLLPDIAPDEPLPPLDALTARHRLFEGLAQLVERHTKVLAVDDLQWADAATLDWLVLLAHRGSTRWVATARRHELPEQGAQALSALEGRSALRWVSLEGLSRGALRELLQEHPAATQSGAAGDASLLEWLHRYTGGNAFFAREVLEALSGGTHATWAAAMPVPDSAALLIERRHQRLDPLARRLVDAAAVSGGTATLSQLAAMVQADEHTCITACEAAERGGLLAGTACRHDLVREALLAPARHACAVAACRRRALAGHALPGRPRARGPALARRGRRPTRNALAAESRRAQARPGRARRRRRGAGARAHPVYRARIATARRDLAGRREALRQPEDRPRRARSRVGACQLAARRRNAFAPGSARHERPD